MANFLLPDEEQRLQGNAVQKPTSGPKFLLPGEMTASESAVPVVKATVGTNPDEAGEARRISRERGIPMPVAEQTLEQLRADARLGNVRRVMDRSPDLARSMNDPTFSKLAHDDVENLDAVAGVVSKANAPERVLTSAEFAEEVRKTKASNTQIDWDTARQLTAARFRVDNTPGGVRPSEAPPSTLTNLAAGVRAAVTEGFAEQTRQGIRRIFGDFFGFDAMSEDAKKKGQQSQFRQFLETPKPDGLAGDVYQGVQSTAQSAPALALGLVNPAVGLGLMGVQSGAPAYQKYRDRGGDKLESATGAVLEGGAEVIFEKVPMDYFVKKFGRVGITEFLAGMLAREIPTEIATTIAQTATDTAIANPNKTWSQWASELPENIRQTVIGTVVQSGLLGGAGVVARRLQMREEDAARTEEEVQAVETLLKFANASKVRERDSTTFQQFVQQAAEDGPVQDIYVDARMFAQAAGENLDVLRQEMLSVGEQLDSALAGGRDLIIPVGEFAAKVPGTVLEQSLLDHIRTAEDMPSRAEAQTFMQEAAASLKEQAEKLTVQAQVDDAAKQSQLRVEEDLVRQLKEANRFTGDVNNAYAKLMASFFGTLAARMNKAGQQTTAEEQYRQFALRVNAQSVAGDQQLDQNTPEFQKWFEGSKVVDETGKPLRVFHGTNRDISEFKGDAERNRMMFDDAQGFYFSKNPEDAGRYAGSLYSKKDAWKGGNVMPVYLAIRNPLRVEANTFTHQYVSPARRAELEAQGYDGIIYNDGEEIVAFKPEQIKSVFNARPTDSPNIMEQPVSTRVPTAKKATENALAERLQVGIEAFLNEPTKLESAMQLISKYVNWFPNPKLRGAEKRAEKFINDVTDNLLWLHDQVPAEIRERSKKWYDGANVIAQLLAERHGITPAQSAAVLAINSPQTEWFTNVSRAERILDIWFGQQGFAWSPQMEAVAAEILSKPQYAEDLAAIKGKTLADIESVDQQAMWIRVYDQAHNNRNFRIVTPEGTWGDFVKTGKGEDSTTAWGSFGSIAKSILVIKDGSQENISKQLGLEHKVRSFYNNIVAPNDPAGDVTIDTHAVAAGLLRPLGGSALEVTHNLGGGVSSAFTGVSGTYGIYAEAYRRAAAQRGLLPREMQSITWEAVRGLYTPEFKRSKGYDAVEKVWQEYRAGKIDEAGVRAKISEIAGGINEPNWWQSDSRPSTQTWSSSYGGELLELRVSGPAAGGTAGRDQDGSGSGGAGSGRPAAAGENRLQQGWAGREPGLVAASALARQAARGVSKLVGLPDLPLKVGGEWYIAGPVGVAHDAARDYVEGTGQPYTPVRNYVPVDEARAKRIAAAFDEMKHSPNDPEVKAAYRAMIDETLAQYQAIKATGLKIEFITGDDPYAESPRQAIVDVIQNNHLWVFPTDNGFGSSGADVSGNPLLELTDEYIGGKRLRANDVFRIVHDYFGHIKDGNGFRAEGEENAWRSHSAMYSPLARRAMTTETRGQNSWVNFGPHGAKNRKASAADTVYADQKIGLLPEWVSEEGRTDAVPPQSLPAYGIRTPGSVSVVGVHFSRQPLSHVSTATYGTNAAGAERSRVMNANDKRLRARSFFYVNEGQGVKAERGVGSIAHVVRLENLYDVDADPLRIWDGKFLNNSESAILDAGFDGYYARNSFTDMGTVTLLGNHVVPVLKAGFETDANALIKNDVAPAPRYSVQRQVASLILNSKDIPAGRMAPAEWKAKIDAAMPDVSKKLPSELFAGNDPIYRDDLVRALFQGEQARGQITFGNDITQTPSVITLLKNADLSTFLHEAGHFYLEVLTNVANQPNAPQEIVDDMDKLFKWFGVAGGLGEWNAMTLEQKRPHHEKFARGFEAYLFEGKAPSVELKSAFSRFRAWLINVYRQLAGLNVQLDDTVRGVFDRMIATEEQIKEAEALRGFAPIFKSAEEMGATPEEWAAYQNLHSDATETATEQLQARSLRDMQWTANARARALRKLQNDAAAKRKAIEAEVTAEVQQEKVYAVQKWLKTGVLPDGTQTVGAKLDLAALKEMYGEDPAAPWRYLSNGVNGLAGNEGLHPDQVAEMFGYSSGDSMVKAILAADPESTVIEGMTDQRMLERYGDLSSPAGLEKAANEAVHNEARGRFIATELAALNNAVNVREDTGRTVTDSRGRTRKITTNVMAKAAKDFATNLINRSKIKDIKPSQYATAEGRAAKNAERTKNFTEKVTEKRNQLVNHYAARAANDAVDYVEKQVAYLRKVADSETIDQEYRDQIQQLLEKVELRRVTEGTLRKRASLLEWIEDQEAKGLDPVIDRALVESAQQINYRTMTLEEFRGLVDTVKNIEHLGRLKHKLLTAKDERDLAQAVEELRASVEANHNREAKVRIETGRGLERLGKMARGFVAMHRKFASIAREMDGGKDGGPMWERLIRPMNEAGDNEIAMRSQATEKLSEIFKLLDGIKLTRKEQVLPGVSMTREARIMLALNWGNEGNRQRVIDGGLDGRRRLTQAEAEQIVFGLTSKEWDFVESMWAFVESYRPMIAEQEKRLTGVEPKWVEPAAFTLPNGRTIRGGYFPAKYDGELSSRSNELEAITDLRQQMQGAAGRSSTRNGYTKERSEAVKDRPLRKDFGVIMQHVGEVTHRLAWQDYLIDARRLLNAKPLDSAIREFYGPEILREMKEQLKDIAVGDIGAQSDLDRLLGHIRSGVTIAGMGWNLMTGMMQPLGLSQSIVRVGAPWMSKGLAHFAANPIKATEVAQAKSKFMASRSLQLNRDLSDILNKIDKEKLSKVENSYFWFIYKFQTAIDVPTWWGAYEKAIAENNEESRAIALADQAVIDAQGGGALKDQARIQRGGSAQKLFTAFYSFFNTTYNLAVEQGRTAGVKGGMAVPKLASDYLLLLVIPAIAGALLKAALKGELDDDELAKKLAAEQLNYLFGTMVLTREIGGGIAAAVNGFNYTGPASLRLFGEIGKFAKQAEQGELDAALFKAANNIAGIILHYPAGQVQRTVEGMLALLEGETSNPAAVLFGPPKN